MDPQNPLSARYVAVSTETVADGDFLGNAACVAILVLADGSETPPPDGDGTFNVGEGEISTGVMCEHTYRGARFVKGDAAALEAVRNTPGVVCSVIARGLGSYTDVGPGIVRDVVELGNNVGDEPGGVRFPFKTESADYPEDIYALRIHAATIAAA